MAAKFPKFDEVIHKTDKVMDPTDSKLQGKSKKRAWFKSLYSTDPDSRSIRVKTVCKFFSSTGVCREGESCQFVHTKDTEQRQTIDEPCKFLYVGTRGCVKGKNCHFSHELSKFRCPYYFGRKDEECPKGCLFDHRKLESEQERLRFSRMYTVFLNSLGDECNLRWNTYLHDLTELEFWDKQTNKHASNLFHVPIGI